MTDDQIFDLNSGQFTQEQFEEVLRLASAMTDDQLAAVAIPGMSDSSTDKVTPAKAKYTCALTGLDIDKGEKHRGVKAFFDGDEETRRFSTTGLWALANGVHPEVFQPATEETATIEEKVPAANRKVKKTDNQPESTDTESHGQLRSFVERIEVELAEITQDRKDIYMLARLLRARRGHVTLCPTGAEFQAAFKADGNNGYRIGIKADPVEALIAALGPHWGQPIEDIIGPTRIAVFDDSDIFG